MLVTIKRGYGPDGSRSMEPQCPSRTFLRTREGELQSGALECEVLTQQARVWPSENGGKVPELKRCVGIPQE